MKKTFFLKYVELVLAFFSIYLLFGFVTLMMMNVLLVTKVSPFTIGFGEFGTTIITVQLLLPFIGGLILARAWTAKEKAGIANSDRWHSVLQRLIAGGLSSIMLIFGMFFFTTSMSVTTSIVDKPSFIQILPQLELASAALMVLSALLLLFKISRKVGAWLTLLIVILVIVRDVADSGFSLSYSFYLFFGLFIIPAACLFIGQGLFGFRLRQ